MNRPLREVCTSHGNVLRGEYKGMQVESDGVTWVHIIDDDNGGAVEVCEIDEGNVVSVTGEIVTESWNERDWLDFTKFVLD